MTTHIFQRLYPPAAAPEGPALWLVFRDAELVVPQDRAPTLLEGTHTAPSGMAIGTALLLGAFDGRPCLAGAIPADAPLPPGFRALGLRAVLAEAEPELAALASYAAQLLVWARTSRFCPACAQPLDRLEGTWGRVCMACGHTLYPPVSPAVIVLVHDGERALLTSKPGWGRRYSLIAGFVEPGETLEECVVREVREEVGVEVADLRYVGSQSWPFPHQIMIGFMARYAGGAIAIDATELADAAWFTREALPDLPPPFTISRRIIELWRSGATP
jgi:NAD+ diphosphatase